MVKQVKGWRQATKGCQAGLRGCEDGGASRQKSSMRSENQSSVSQFLLLGLPIPPGQQGVFFTLFLGMYLTTVLGNLLIILLIRLDSRLHTPMYVAICHPLHYTTIMSEGLCVLLVAGCWILSCAHDLLHTLLLVRLSFSADNTIPHFYCDLAALLKLSCSDVSLNKLMIFTEAGILFFLPFGIILGSYIRIGTIMLRVSSTKRLVKTFSTCGSHLSVVFLYYGTAAGVYFFSSSWGSKDIIASVMYTVVTPMLNPFIYSLRNRDIKQALEMCVNRVKFFKMQSLNPLVAVASMLNGPVPVVQRVEAQLVCDLSCIHGIGEVLFVCEHEQDSSPELILRQQPHKLLLSLIHTLWVMLSTTKMRP
ncbi:hypothetical protein QTO34_005205, partial [Cnephaeus nilssonii]